MTVGVTGVAPVTFNATAVAGAPAIKSATLSVTVDYESDAPLA